MSTKIGRKKKLEILRQNFEAPENDSWALVELYRWQHGHLPDNSGKGLSVPEAMRTMARGMFAPDSRDWPIPQNIVSVLHYAARLLENPELPKVYPQFNGRLPDINPNQR